MPNDSIANALAGDARDTVVNSLDGIAVALKYLGNGDAGTSMGAIEAFGVVVRDGLGAISASLDAMAEAQERQAAAIEKYLEWRQRAGI